MLIWIGGLNFPDREDFDPKQICGQWDQANS